MTIRSRDKVLPVQPFFSSLWAGEASYADAVADAVTAHALEQLPPLAIDGPEGRTEELASPPALLSFLAMLAEMLGAGRILEVGTFVGVTAMHLAKATGASVTTIEASAAFAGIARENIERNGLARVVSVMEGDAADVLDLLYPSFDLVFLDGAKQSYPDLAGKIEGLLSPGGVIVVDDVFFHGDALNTDPATGKGRGARAVIDRYRRRSDFRSSLLPIGNGVLLLRRKA